MTVKTSRYLTLDAMRGVAAIAVVALHSQPSLWNGLALPSGHLAVDFFFALSGFVLAHAYLDRLCGKLNVIEFMRLRLIRLYPLFLLAGCLAGAFIVIRFLRGGIPLVDALSAAPNILFIPAPTWSAHIYPLNFPAWSLALELLVNIIFAMIARHLLGWRGLLMIIMLGWLGIVGSGLTFGNLDIGVRWTDWWGGPPRVVYSFFVGVALHRLSERLSLPLSPWMFPPLVVAFASTFLLSGGPFYDLVIVSAVYPVMILLGAGIQAPWPKVASYLGDTSYAVYILHIPVRWFLEAAMAVLHVAPNAYIGLAFIAGTVGLASLADILFDRPVRRWLSKRPSAAAVLP